MQKEAKISSKYLLCFVKKKLIKQKEQKSGNNTQKKSKDISRNFLEASTVLSITKTMFLSLRLVFSQKLRQTYPCEKDPQRFRV